MKEIKITSNGIKQAIDDLVDENERLQDKVYKLEDIIKEVRELINYYGTTPDRNDDKIVRSILKQFLEILGKVGDEK